MLEPLSQWFCDACGEIIQTPGDGWFEWVQDDDGKAHSFRICHTGASSPRKGNGGHCFEHADARGRLDLPLEDFLGPSGMANMLSMIDIGEIHDPDQRSLLKIRDPREWVVMFRRLYTPFFEEARRLFTEAKADGFFADANEIWPYRESHLRAVIEDYGDDE